MQIKLAIERPKIAIARRIEIPVRRVASHSRESQLHREKERKVAGDLFDGIFQFERRTLAYQGHAFGDADHQVRNTAQTSHPSLHPVGTTANSALVHPRHEVTLLGG